MNDEPREFQEPLSIEQQAEGLSPTSRKRFLESLAHGVYDDTESQVTLLKFYKIEDEITRLEAQEKQSEPVYIFRGRRVPNPLRKMIGDLYKESARYFRILGLDQSPRGGDQKDLFR